MGTANFLRGIRSGGLPPRLASPTASSGFRQPAPKATRSTKGIPERLNVNDWFDAASQQGAGLFGTLGQLPSRIYETPMSLVDVAAKRTLGVSPFDALAKTPVGAVGGALGGGIERASNAVPALLNNQAMTIWSAVAGLPDDTEITDALVDSRLGWTGAARGVADFTTKTEGGLLGALPIIGGLFGRNKTVGELRAELTKRGFFADPATGTPIDPVALADDVRSGRKSALDFGNRAVNDNALVDLATRIVTDPTNALFFVPGANLAKLGATAAKLLPAARLIRAGQLAVKAPRAIVAAEAITQGNRASATLAGMARVLKGYRKLSIGTSVGNFAINRLTSILPDEALPFQTEIEEFTKSVEERRPMSGNAAFMLLSAATFPYGRYVRGAVKAQRDVRARAFGVGEMAPFYAEWGSKAKFHEEFGGRAGERQVADFIDKQIARDERRLTPKEVANMQSIGDAGLRRRFEQQALERIVDRMRSKGEITGAMRLAKWKEWDASQAGFEDKGIANPFDPTRSARRWRAFEPVREVVDPVLRDTGEAIWGLRDDVVFTEQVTAVHDVLKNARFKDAEGKSRVEVAAILDVLTDHPNINSLDTKGFWARFGAPDAPAPSWDSISRRLARLRRESTKIEDYTNELAVWEKRAPADIETTTIVPRAQRMEELQVALRDTVDESGTIKPDRVGESQTLQRELEGLKAEENGIHWARTAEHDAKTGADPAVGRAIDDALETDDFLRPTRMSPGIDRLTRQSDVQRVVALEREVLKINPSYRVKRAPEKQVLALVPEDGAISVALRQYTALGEWLHQTGPLSTLSKFWNGLTRPVMRDELAGGTKSALMSELVPLGVKPKQAEGLLREMEQRVKDSVLLKAPGGFTVRYMRDIGSIMPGEVNRIAARHLSEKTLAALDKQGGFYRVLARTGSRYWRSIDSKARKGDKGAAALQGIYRVWTEAPGLSELATTQRSIAKFIYPLFRFALDPRWLALNAIESQTLMFSKHGVGRAYKSMADASPAARYFTSNLDAEAASSFSPEIGYSLGRELNMLTAKSFDASSAKSVAAVIDEFGMRDPAVSALRSSLMREAKDTISKVERQFKDGEITERTYLAERAKADKQLQSGSGSLATHLNDTLYRYEKKGVDATVLEEARSILNADELRVMQPLIDRVTDVNRKLWNDIQLTLHGNPSRSTIERLANSYWLLWPLSYQIKATKWLANIMLDGSFGHNNNALLAGKYALWQEQHKERILNNPAYAAMYEAQPSLWFAAQQLLPMNPEDIGVSLSKIGSLAGTVGQRFLNEWLGTEIGAFTADKKLDDGAAAISWLTNMGPTYTFELAQRVLNEADDGSNKSRASLPSIQPIPATAGGQTPVPVR